MAHDVIYNLNLVVSSVLITIAIIFAMLFFKEWRKQKRTANEQYIPLALAVFYLFLSIGFIMMTNSNFFIDPAIFQIYIETGMYFYFILTACVLVIGIFVYIAERIIRKNTRHLFLIYFGVIATLFYVFKAMNLPNLEFYILLLIPIAILIGLFAYYLIWKSSGQIRQQMLIVTIGYSVFILAIVILIRFILTRAHTPPGDLTLFIIPLEIKLLTLFASILAGYGFYSIPSFTEFDWKLKIDHLYLISPQGICLFQQFFKTKITKDEDLFGGSLIAIQSLMQEMIESDKKIKVIDHEAMKIIFEESPHVIAVMVAEENLYIVHSKLQQLLKEFELLFGPSMKDWTGDVKLFTPLGPLISRIFEIEDIQPKHL